MNALSSNYCTLKSCRFDKIYTNYYDTLEGCLTVHFSHEIKRNANLMQIGNFIDVFLARHVSGTYAHHQEH